MNQELKDSAQELVTVFLDTMPEDVFKRYSEQKLHHQLSYFFCWATLVKEEVE